MLTRRHALAATALAASALALAGGPAPRASAQGGTMRAPELEGAVASHRDSRDRPGCSVRPHAVAPRDLAWQVPGQKSLVAIGAVVEVGKPRPFGARGDHEEFRETAVGHSRGEGGSHAALLERPRVSVTVVEEIEDRITARRLPVVGRGKQDQDLRRARQARGRDLLDGDAGGARGRARQCQRSEEKESGDPEPAPELRLPFPVSRFPAPTAPAPGSPRRCGSASPKRSRTG